MRKTYLYIWSDGIKYYAGKADNPKARLGRHLSNSFNKNSSDFPNKKSRYIRETYRSVSQARAVIKLIEIQKIPYENWEELEIALIRHLRETYPDNVLNTSDGGKSAPVIIKVPQEVVDFVRDNYRKKSTTELANLFNTDTGWVSKVIYNLIRYDHDYNPPAMRNRPSKVKWTHHQIQWLRSMSYDTDYKTITDYFYYEFGLDISATQVRNIILNKVEFYYDQRWDSTNRVYTSEPWS